MRKILSLITALLFAGLTAMWAIPANPEPFKAKQPDGSTITLRLHGDEFYSWVTSEDGKTLYKKDANGWWRPAGSPKISRSAVNKAKELRRQRDAMFHKNGKNGLGLGMGNNHFLIILVEWADDHFSEGACDYFKQIIGQKNYSGNGFVGSARDYYYEASYGKFDPNFDVYGPITLDRNHNDWVANDTEGKYYATARAMVQEAIAKLSQTVDLSQYDCNGDHLIDNVYMIHAGYDAADHAENSIWSHASSAYDGKAYNGVYINSYATSAEFQGASGTTFDGIGTFCHEFGHVIGMPDLYDIDYEENGEARHPSMWNLMAGGNRNSNSRIPARLSSYERYILGYLTDADKVDLSSPGNKTLSGLSSQKLYYLPTVNEGEFFIAEVHDGQNWDSPLPECMIIYHADQSNNDVHGYTAAQLWDNWDINIFGDHPCYYIVCPDETAYNGQAKYYYQLWPFPMDQWNGRYYKVTDYSPTAWNGTQQFNLSNINYTDGQATFTVSPGQRCVVGSVSEIKTNTPIKDAVVVVEPQSQQSSKIKSRIVSLAIARRNAIAEATTDANGKYKITLPDNAPESLTISVFAEGYLSSQESVSSTGSISKDFKLTSVIDGLIPDGVTKVSFPLTTYSQWGWDETYNLTVAVKYTAEELKDHVGKQIKDIAFGCSYGAEEAFVFVDFGTQRVLAKTVAGSSINTLVSENKNGPANVVDVTEKNIVIPENTDIYVGYALKNTSSYTILTDGNSNTPEGVYFVDRSYSTTGTTSWTDPVKDWGLPTFGNVLVSFNVQSDLSINPDAKLTEMGLCYIDMPATLTAGNSLPLKLVYSKAKMPYEVEWYYDGAKIDSQYVSLVSGKHTLRATLKFSDGKPGYSVAVKFTVQ